MRINKLEETEFLRPYSESKLVLNFGTELTSKLFNFI